MDSTGLVASLVNWLPQNSTLSQLLISWFGDSGTQAVASFVDQVREGYGGSDLAPASFVTASGNTIKVWDSVSSDGKKRELNYSVNDGPTITTAGCVALLCVELAQTARKAINEATNNPDFSATERDLLEKITLDNFEFSGSDLQGTDLSGLSLRNASFLHCKLEDVKLVKCDLEGAYFQTTTMNEGTWFNQSNIQGTDIRSCYFYGASFEGVYGKSTNFITPSRTPGIPEFARTYNYSYAGPSSDFKRSY